MPERRIDSVQIALSRQTITIPWESRQALLERLRPLDTMRDVVSILWAVGTSRPVELTKQQQGDLLEAIRAWSQEVAGGYGGLPEGIEQLRHALVDDG